MNKIAIAISAALALGAIGSAQAAETINFTGTIDAASCGVAVGGSSATGTAVTLQRIPKANIETGTDASKETPFNVVIGSAASPCPVTMTSVLKFSGAGLDASGRIANGTGTATNVALNLVDSTGKVLDLRSDEVESTDESAGAGIYTHAMKARYVRPNPADAVVEGTFVGAVDIDLSFR